MGQIMGSLLLTQQHPNSLLIPPWPFIQGGNPYKGCHISFRMFILHLSHLKRKMRKWIIMYKRADQLLIRTKNRGISFRSNQYAFSVKCNRLKYIIYFSPVTKFYKWTSVYWTTERKWMGWKRFVELMNGFVDLYL